MFEYAQLVRVATRPNVAQPFFALIASKPIGLKEVPALGVFYFVVAPGWCGYVSADRLVR